MWRSVSGRRRPEAGTTACPDAAATLTADDVAVLRQRLQRLRKVDEVLGGADSYSLYAAEVNRSHELLKGSFAKPAVRVQLVGLYAEQTQQAGWAAFDAGWDGAAAHLFRLSSAAAEDAGDHGTASNALALRAPTSSLRRGAPTST